MPPAWSAGRPSPRASSARAAPRRARSTCASLGGRRLRMRPGRRVRRAPARAAALVDSAHVTLRSADRIDTQCQCQHPGARCRRCRANPGSAGPSSVARRSWLRPPAGAQAPAGEAGDRPRGWLLFAERGYEKTTVAEIARAAGISRRSFSRYFSSKEHGVIGTTDAIAEDVLAAFASRPKGEPPLVAIQRAIEPAIETRLVDAAEARAIVSLLRESRTLRRAMLERHARLEERLAALIAVRTGADPGTRSDAGAARVPRARPHGHRVERSTTSALRTWRP